MFEKEYLLPLRKNALSISLALISSQVLAEEQAKLTDCAVLKEDAARLSCYDKLFPPRTEQTEAPKANPVLNDLAKADPNSIAVLKESPRKQTTLPLAMYWETDPAYKRGVFAFRPHYDNYFLLAKYNSDTNNAPFQQTFNDLPPNERKLKHTEVAFQLGFKMKMMEDLPYTHSDLWFAYTQQSFWQAYSKRLSSPFRDTNYQPELMFVTPLNWSILGANIRFLNLGLAHQSNGRSNLTSRSWNRTYAQFGMETGKVETLFRVWHRLSEPLADDDNPDITNYMGYGDIISSYRWNDQKVSLMLRRNFSTNKGATQLTWSFPLKEYLNGYVHIFSGYGESLIDYNFYQKSIGLGFLIDY